MTLFNVFIVNLLGSMVMDNGESENYVRWDTLDILQTFPLAN